MRIGCATAAYVTHSSAIPMTPSFSARLSAIIGLMVVLAAPLGCGDPTGLVKPPSIAGDWVGETNGVRVSVRVFEFPVDDLLLAWIRALRVWYRRRPGARHDVPCGCLGDQWRDVVWTDPPQSERHDNRAGWRLRSVSWSRRQRRHPDRFSRQRDSAEQLVYAGPWPGWGNTNAVDPATCAIDSVSRRVARGADLSAAADCRSLLGMHLPGIPTGSSCRSYWSSALRRARCLTSVIVSRLHSPAPTRSRASWVAAACRDLRRPGDRARPKGRHQATVPSWLKDISAERFVREFKVAARLQQANIVPVLRAGEVDGLWKHADPELQPIVANVRARMNRLESRRAR